MKRQQGRRVRFARFSVRTKLFNPQFVTFLEKTRFRRDEVTRHERRMRRRSILSKLAYLAGALTFGWIVLESAQAISLF